jgi:CDP-glucose 4,6-dehydratase
LSPTMPRMQQTKATEREMMHLSLDTALAQQVLGYVDRLPGRLALEWTADWYVALKQGQDMMQASLAQIEAFTQLRGAA